MCSLLLLLLLLAATAGRITSQEHVVVTLSAWCHGLVRVQGISVCSDHWDDKHSQVVCQYQDCGDAVGFQRRRTTWSQVYHFRCNGSESSLGQCERVLGKCDGGLVSVNCTGRYLSRASNCSPFGLTMIDGMPLPMCPGMPMSNRRHIPNFKDSRDRCSGNLKLDLQGEQLSVCGEDLKDLNVRNAICRELECGETGGYLEHLGPLPQNPKMVPRLWCSANVWGVLNCNVMTQNFGHGQCSFAGLRCSDWQEISLQHPKRHGRASEGTVIVDSVNGPMMVSNHGWTEEEGEKLCQHLNLSGYISHAASELSSPMWVKSFNCSDAKEPKTIWDCEREERPSGNRGVYLQCGDSTTDWGTTIIMIVTVLVIVAVFVLLFRCLRRRTGFSLRNQSQDDNEDEHEDVGDSANVMSVLNDLHESTSEAAEDKDLE